MNTTNKCITFDLSNAISGLSTLRDAVVNFEKIIYSDYSTLKNSHCYSIKHFYTI